MLPDIILNHIASFLDSKDLSQVIATTSWLQVACSGLLSTVKLRGLKRKGRGVVARLLQHRPGVSLLSVKCRIPTLGLADALNAGHCQKLRALALIVDDVGSFRALCQALSGTVCPHLDILSIDYPMSVGRKYDRRRDLCRGDMNEVVVSLAQIMADRAAKGYAKLRFLLIGGLIDFSPFFHTQACDEVEWITLCSQDGEQQERCGAALAAWAIRTRAIRLHWLDTAFTCGERGLSEDAISALCLPGVAPLLQRLKAGYLMINEAFVSGLVNKISGFGWPWLTQVDLRVYEIEDEVDEGWVKRLLDALEKGAPWLWSFKVDFHYEEWGAQEMMLGLEGWKCRFVQELEVTCAQGIDAQGV